MDLVESKNLLDSVDARTRLAGSNKMEILLFSLGTREIFRDQCVQGARSRAHAAHHQDAQHAAWRRGADFLRGNVIPVCRWRPSCSSMARRPAGQDHDGRRILEAHSGLPGARGRSHHPRRLGAGEGAGKRALQQSGPDHRRHRAGKRWSGIHLDVEQILANAFGEAMIVDIAPARSAPIPASSSSMIRSSPDARLPRFWTSSVSAQACDQRPGGVDPSAGHCRSCAAKRQHSATRCA
jgi:two-component system, chemotaxis family, chemotaxis protein CheV